MNTVEVLKKSKFLTEASSDQLSTLANLCTQEEFKPGETILKQDDEANKLCLIEEGLVSIIVELGQGRERQIQTASRFEIIGFSALVKPYRYTATVKAIERTRTLVFDGRELRSLRLNNPDLALKLYIEIATVIAGRLHSTFLQLIGIT